nr:G-type lectin S-receptor-like serine/threonine-protein kinase At1g61490 [Ziziphus jujuba var. spinosa]
MHAKDRYCRVLGFFSIFVLFHCFPSPCCCAIYNITSSQALSQGQTLLSASKIFEVGFFTPTNSGNKYVGIWFNKPISTSKVVVWVANRENPLAVTDSAATLTIGSNGNLNLLDGKENSVWSTDIPVPSNTSFAELFDNGNFVLKDSISGQVLWQTFEHPSDTFLSKAKIGFNVKTGERFVLTSWKTETDPSPGNFTVGLSHQRPPQALVWINGSTRRWRSGPWDNTKFLGVPQMYPIYLSGFKLTDDVDQGTTTLSFDIGDYYHMFISSEGVLKAKKKEKDTDWYTAWQAPNSTCEAYGVCGPYAFCKTIELESTVCKCLKGFVPKSKEEWSKGNWTGGCVRRTKLLCEKNNGSSASSGGKKDRFWKKSTLKLPDFYTLVPPVDADSCGRWCRSNCSCIAFAFVDGIGCLIWSNDLIDIQEFPDGGQDLFLRLAHSELGELSFCKVIISLAAICGTAILGGLFLAWCRLRAKQDGKIKDTMNYFDLIEKSDNSRDNLRRKELHDPSELAIFEYDTMLVATNNFSISNKLGQGGFGPVYKGKLKDGKEIAVKRLSCNSGQGIEEFKNEMILISKLQHRSLVKLMGCCIYEEEKLLIYEFMPNKSLDFFLFDPRRRSELSWATRFKIIHGVAKGILYLHRDSCLRVIHRDLKASNILLDAKMNAKISDFGLARIFEETIDLANTQRVVGTLGYMSPEYAMGGIFSEKSDVYSFGVLLLEIVSGKKNNSFHYRDQQLSLIAHAWQLWSECRPLELIDETLADSYCSSEVIRCIDVGLLCTQDHAIDRPTMPQVVLMLSNEIDRPKPKQPLFYSQGSLKFDLKPQSVTKGSTNEATISMIEGR